jgi:polyferredoxin
VTAGNAEPALGRSRGRAMLAGSMPAAPTVPPTPSRQDPLDFLPRQDRHKPKCGPVRPSRVSRKRAYVLIAVHVVIGLHIWHWLATGTTLTPVEPSEAMQTLEEGRINAGFVLFCTLIAGTLVFGRFFCGWACHLVALQDLCAWLLGKLGLHPRPLRSRLLVLAPWLVAGHMFVWPQLQHLLLHYWPELPGHLVGWPRLSEWFTPRELPKVADWQLQLMTDELWKTFPGPIMTVGTFVVAGFLIVWWLGAKGFCTHGCPYGAFFALADRFAPVRIKVTDACDACGHCTSVCSSNVRVHEEVAKYGKLVDPGCMKCLDCVSVCPKEALYVGLAMPKPFTKSQQRITARADLSWPEEILVAAVALVTTQLVFRGAWFGEGIAFLMAVALGVITGVMTLLACRLFVRTAVTFQHTTLKRDGRLLPAGRRVAVLLLGWLVFTVHTGYVEWLRDDARRMVGEPVRASIYGTRQLAAGELEAPLAAIDQYRGWALLDDPLLVELRGLVLRGLGRHADAEQQLLACLGKHSALAFDEANLALASYMMDQRRQRFADARRLVQHVLDRTPAHPIGKLLMQRLDSLPR